MYKFSVFSPSAKKKIQIFLFFPKPNDEKCVLEFFLFNCETTFFLFDEQYMTNNLMSCELSLQTVLGVPGSVCDELSRVLCLSNFLSTHQVCVVLVPHFQLDVPNVTL